MLPSDLAALQALSTASNELRSGLNAVGLHPLQLLGNHHGGGERPTVRRMRSRRRVGQGYAAIGGQWRARKLVGRRAVQPDAAAGLALTWSGLG